MPKKSPSHDAIAKYKQTSIQTKTMRRDVDISHYTWDINHLESRLDVGDNVYEKETTGEHWVIVCHI